MFRSQDCLHPPALPSFPRSFSALSVNGTCPGPARVLGEPRYLTHSDPLAQISSDCQCPTDAIPFRIKSFAHPHHLTPIESYSCKKQGRGWGPIPARPHPVRRAHERPQLQSLHAFTHDSLDTSGWGVIYIQTPQALPLRQRNHARACCSLFAAHGKQIAGHVPRLPRPLQLFNLQLSTSSSTIPALHSGAQFTMGDR
jgi:hypothetical protein